MPGVGPPAPGPRVRPMVRARWSRCRLFRTSLAAGAPQAPQPCWMPTSRIHQALAAWRAQSCFRPRAPSQARVRGPCLPLHSSPRGCRGRIRAASVVHLKPGHCRDFIVCSCRSSYLAVRVGLDAPTIGGSVLLRQCLGHRTGVQDTGDAQGPPEGAPALREREASRIRMQVRSPTRPTACRIRHDAEMISAEIDRDEPQQLGGWHTLPTPDARANRRRVTYHRAVYPALSACAAPGPPT